MKTALFRRTTAAALCAVAMAATTMLGGSAMAAPPNAQSTPVDFPAADGQLMSFEHNGFWQPMDTLRDKNLLEELWLAGKAPWKVW